MADIKKAKDQELMHILLTALHNGERLYVRRVLNVFIWDVIYQSELYSNSLLVDGGKITKEVIDEAVNICRAGACETIDRLKSKIIN